MKLINLSPVFYTLRLTETEVFYTTKLDFKVISGSPGEGWILLRRDSIEVMFSLPNEHIPFKEPLFTGSFYFRTDRVELLWNKLKTETEVVYELEAFDYGMKEFAIRDNNGYILQFGESIRT